MKVALLFVAICLCSVVAVAQDGSVDDGNALLKQCTPAAKLLDGVHVDNSEIPDAMFCIGYIRATLDVYATWEGTDTALGRKQSVWPCLPFTKSIQTGQGVLIVVKYLKEHPEKLHLDNAALAAEALREAFPCKVATS